jgi:hypothetical protein
MIYIVVGTYKTNPENCGWYLNGKYKNHFWDKFNLNKYYEVKNIEVRTFTVSNYTRKYGELVLENGNKILFYDLLNHQTSLSDNKITSDNEIFKLSNQSALMKQGAKYFTDWLYSIITEEEIRVGFIGKRALSLINYETTIEKTDYKSFKSITKHYYDLSLLKNKFNSIEFFELFALTGRPTKEAIEKDVSWPNFLKGII